MSTEEAAQLGDEWTAPKARKAKKADQAEPNTDTSEEETAP